MSRYRTYIEKDEVLEALSSLVTFHGDINRDKALAAILALDDYTADELEGG